MFNLASTMVLGGLWHGASWNFVLWGALHGVFLIGERVILKIYRRLEAGVHPELEIGRFLTDVAGYANTPPLYGSI